MSSMNASFIIYKLCMCTARVCVCICMNVTHFNFVVLTKQRPRIWNDHFLLQQNDIMSIQYMYFSMKTCGCNREKQSYEELPVVFKSSLQSASFCRFKYYCRQSWREKKTLEVLICLQIVWNIHLTYTDSRLCLKKKKKNCTYLARSFLKVNLLYSCV